MTNDIPHWRPSLNLAQEVDRLRDHNAELQIRVMELETERDEALAGLQLVNNKLAEVTADRDTNLTQRWDARNK